MTRVLILGACVFLMATFVSGQRCTGAQLKVTAGQEDADMGGKRYASYVFENTSQKACTLQGFPKLAALNRRGTVLSTVPVSYTNDYPNGDSEAGRHPKRVTLAAGGKAWFQIYYNDGMALRRPRGGFPKVAKVRIMAPSDVKAFVLKSDFQVCCGIQVGSVRPGSPDQN